MRQLRLYTITDFFRSCSFSAVCIVIMLCLASSIFAQSQSSLFKQANLYYEKSEYQKALETYEKILTMKDASSADLFYNIGNCYFKLNDLGYAILNYKRASLLRPRDFFIQHNLEFARSLVEYTIEDKRPWHVRMSEKWLASFTELEFVTSVLISLAFLLASCVCYLLFPQYTLFKKLMSFFIVLFMVFTILMIRTVYFDADTRSGVIVDDDVKVYSGPISTENVVFRLVQGLEITIQEKRGDWFKIKLNNGSVGWVRSAFIQPVYPHLFQSKINAVFDNGHE